MSIMLVHASDSEDEIRVAVTINNKLVDYEAERAEISHNKSNIYKGIISSIEPSLGAVFVKYDAGDEKRHGFLPIKEISPEYFLKKSSQFPPNPNDVLKVGQELVVQVEKEERGNKGAALTTYISLAGSYLVLMPNNPRAGGISRRIDGDEREQVKNILESLDIPEGMGVIVRTAGVDRDISDLAWDLKFLLRYWEAIKQAAVMKQGAYLIHQEGDVIIRAIRDYLRPDTEEIIIDDEKSFEKAKQYIGQVRPDLLDKLRRYDDSLPLFSRYQIEQQIEEAYQREVRLPSGGSLVIDHTEALVSIDINSARATKGRDIEETAFKTNMEAARAIARELRIRDIGGLIVIDFIDMTPMKNQRDVENCLRDAMKNDRARVQIGRISRFGLLELSRQRLRSNLSRTHQITCPRCCGKGTIRSVESLTLFIIHMIQEQAAKEKEHLKFQIQLPVDVATYLMNEKRKVIESIENNHPIEVVIIPNVHLQTPHYLLKQIRKNELTGKGKSHVSEPVSYKQVKVVKEDNGIKNQMRLAKADGPAVTEFLRDAPLSDMPKRKKAGLIRRILKALFGGGSSKPAKKNNNEKGQRRRSPNGRRRNQNNRNTRGRDRDRNERGGRGDQGDRDDQGGNRGGRGGRGRGGRGRNNDRREQNREQGGQDNRRRDNRHNEQGEQGNQRRDNRGGDRNEQHNQRRDDRNNERGGQDNRRRGRGRGRRRDHNGDQRNTNHANERAPATEQPDDIGNRIAEQQSKPQAHAYTGPVDSPVENNGPSSGYTSERASSYSAEQDRRHRQRLQEESKAPATDTASIEVPVSTRQAPVQQSTPVTTKAPVEKAAPQRIHAPAQDTGDEKN